MTYDHNTKAGNEGDVVKHVALVAAIGSIARDAATPFTFADAFAGYGWNPLERGTEWRRGIGRFESLTSARTPALHWYLEHVVQPALAEGRYPGSSTIARTRSESPGTPTRLHLWDTSATAVADLRATHEGATIEHRAAHPAEVAAAAPTLLLVDPPGIRSDAHPEWPDWEFLQALMLSSPSFLVWLPLSAADDGGVVTQAHHFGYETTRVVYKDTGSTIGCQLLSRLPEPAAEAMRAAVGEACRLMQWRAEHSG